MKLADLLFFNKSGQLIETRYNEKLNLIQANIYLPEVSVGLIENETIHIVQKTTANGKDYYTVPYNDQSFTEILEFSWKENKNYKFFTVDNPYEDAPYINSFYTKEEILSSNFSNRIEELETTLRIDVAFRSKTEGPNENILIITRRTLNEETREYNEEIIAEITFYCEAVAEDDRFVNALANFGEYISEKEEYIFRNSDISEESPDYKLLNLKRKEFLLEMHNIKPYFSSYKGIINILNLFDYSDIRLKEYWYDVKAKKLIPETINLYEEKQLENSENYNPNYKKTTFFGLFYDFNKVVEGQYTEDGLPLVVDNFLFSNEEIIIKLFGLKEWIKDREIGGICTIIDIIGEWTFFNKYNINFWYDDYTIEGKTADIVQPSITVDKSIAYIEDLRPKLEDWNTCELPRENPILPSCIVSAWDKCKVGWFQDNQYGLDNPRGHDEPNIPIGAIVNLHNSTFDYVWDDIHTTWKRTDHNHTTYNVTWDNIGDYQFYEAEWTIRHDNPSHSDFLIHKKGNIKESRDLEIILPYTGTYTVTLTLYRYGNELTQITKHSIIEVRTKRADMLSYFRFINPNLQKYRTCDLQWGNVNSHFGHVVYDNRKYTVDEHKIKFVTETLVEYLPIHIFKDDFMKYSPLSYSQLDGKTWKDYMFNTYDSLVYTGQKLGKFIIKSFRQGGSLQINEDDYPITVDINFNSYEKLCSLISNWNTNPSDQFQEFYFVVRRHKHYGEERNYIEAVSKFFHAERDMIGCDNAIDISGYIGMKTWKDMVRPNTWANVPLKWKNSVNMFSVECRDYPFNYENCRVYSDYFDCPALTPVFFTIDNSEMVGKTSCQWILTNSTTGEELVTLNGMLYFCYTFAYAGQYSIKAIITDSNGNTSEVIKDRIINVYDAEDYMVLENSK